MSVSHGHNAPRHRRGRKPSTAYVEFKLLEVDSQAEGFHHPSVADVQRQSGISIGKAHRYARARNLVIAGLQRKVKEVN